MPPNWPDRSKRSEMASCNKQKHEYWQKTAFISTGVLFFVLVCVVTSYNTYRLITLRNELSELKIKLTNCAGHNNVATSIRSKRSLYDLKDKEPPKSKLQGKIKLQNEDHILKINENVQHFTGSSDESINNTLEPKLQIVENLPVIINNQSSTLQQPVRRPMLKSLDAQSAEFSGDTDSEFRVVREQEVVRRRYPRVGRVKLPAIHLNGDTSKYNIQLHEHYKGNGHIRNLQRTFTDWKPSYWVNKAGMDNHFDFNDGFITIKESGLYLIYAQIYYLDEHDRNGYAIEKNDHKILLCTVAAHTEQRLTKGNTCYTAGVDYVAEGDMIKIVDLSHDRYSIFDTGKSFFGLVKLTDVRIK